MQQIEEFPKCQNLELQAKTNIENCILPFKYLIQRTLSSCILDTLFDITQFIVSQRDKLEIMDSRGYIYCKERTKSTGNEEFPNRI